MTIGSPTPRTVTEKLAISIHLLVINLPSLINSSRTDLVDEGYFDN